MKNYLKLTGLLMSALLCLFTSCTNDDDDDVEKTETGVATVEVSLFVSSETLAWTEGSFIVSFSPSGKKQEVTANDIIFAIDANKVTDAAYITSFESKNVKKTNVTINCDASDKQISIEPNFKVKPGFSPKEGETYWFEAMGVIDYKRAFTSLHNKDYTGASLKKGEDPNVFIKNLNSPFVWLDIR